MPVNRGKEWESEFSKICKAHNISIVRFYDVIQGHKGVDNPADFVISKDVKSAAFLIECKETASTNWGLYFDQYDRLVKLPGFRSVVVVWFVKYKEVWALTLSAITILRNSGDKSFNPVSWRKKGRSLDGVYRLDAEFARIKPKDVWVEKIWEM